MIKKYKEFEILDIFSHGKALENVRDSFKDFLLKYDFKHKLRQMREVSVHS